jgi:hypothetical protein
MPSGCCRVLLLHRHMDAADVVTGIDRCARAHACAIVQSFEPGGDWRWCCADEAYV